MNTEISVGRIVLVKSPRFLGELPAIVVSVFDRYLGIVNAQIFTNNQNQSVMYVSNLRPQSSDDEGWGWRYPPRESAEQTQSQHAVAVSAQEQLARV